MLLPRPLRLFSEGLVRSAALPCSPLRIPVATYREEAVWGVSSQNFIAAGSFQTCEPFWTSRFINLVSNFKTLDKLKPKNRNLTKEFGTIEKLYLCDHHMLPFMKSRVEMKF